MTETPIRDKLLALFPDPSCWCQKHYRQRRFSDGVIVARCLSGAMQDCLDEDEEYIAWDSFRERTGESVVVWNDHHNRTFEDVIDLIKTLDF